MYGKVLHSYSDIKYIDQLKTWQKILGKYVSLGELICNPCRIDKNPGCYLREYNGLILLTDFARPEFNKYTCLHAVAHINNCNLHEAATIVFNNYNYDIILPQFAKTVGNPQKTKENKTEITFEKKKWTNQDIIYWNKTRGIDINQLEADSVYSVSKFTINKKLILADDFCYAYTFPSGNVKIYQPYRKSDKWISNTDANDVWDLGNETAQCIITKAYKDAREIANLMNLKTYAFMNEAVIPNSLSFNKYKKVFIIYDNDEAGITGAKKLSSKIENSVAKFIPKDLGKDIDEVIVKKGLAYSYDLLNHLLNN